MIDVRQNGIGDIVVACWIVHSAAAIGERVRLNPRNHRTVATVLGVPDDCLTRDEAADWSQTLGIGHQFEYRQVDIAPMSRFDAWSYSLGLPGLRPVRPPYRETPEDAAWAEEQWHKVARVESDADAPRVLLFPDAAYSLRVWPRAYFIDLASQLEARGFAVAAMAATQAAVDFMPCRWWAMRCMCPKSGPMGRKAGLKCWTPPSEVGSRDPSSAWAPLTPTLSPSDGERVRVRGSSI